MPILHVFTGDAAADTVRQALSIRDGDFLIQHDVISCGPLRSYTSRDEWMTARQAFWLGLSGGESFGDFPDDMIGEAERIASADRVVAWVGAGLSDRLLVPSFVHLADVCGFSLPPVEVAEITSHPTLSVPVLGWGMLRAKDVGRPAWRKLGQADLSEARRVWDAVTSPEPTAVEALTEDIADPALVNALAVLIERYPDTVRGLSHWDASLMAAMPTAESSVMTVVGGAIGANHQHLDPVGDLYLFWRLRRLSEMREPLVTLTGDTRILHDTIRTCRVRPTELGLAVRSGKANAVDVNGIDDSVGGVHLRASAGSPWYRRDGALIPSSSR